MKHQNTKTAPSENMMAIPLPCEYVQQLTFMTVQSFTASNSGSRPMPPTSHGTAKRLVQNYKSNLLSEAFGHRF
jgi:hypothetical protein